MTTSAAFWGVINGSVAGSRMGSLVTIVAPLGRRLECSIRERDRADPRETPWSGELRERRAARLRRQDPRELGARVDVELDEDFAQVVFDRVRADEEARADLGVGVAVAGEPRDLEFLRRQI